MFPLLRYFSITSAVAVIAVTTALVVFYRQSAISELVASAETHNASLARSFANTIWPEFSGYLTSVNEDGDGLRQRPETKELHGALAGLAEGLPVLKVKIYNLDGLTVYSSQASQMGEDKSGNPGFLTSRGDAKPASKLSFRDSFSAFSGVVENRDLVESYVPIAGADGTVEGVFEVYTDVTHLVDRLERSMTRYVLGFLLISAFLYGLLFVIVRHADRILKKQYLALEESEDRIQVKNASLEQEIDQRQKVESALRTAKEEAEAANRAKSEFLAVVSHEVRTPMNCVLGMTGLLLDSELAQEQRDYAETIQDSGESFMAIINDILDFSKIEAGKLELEETNFNLVMIIDQVIELLGPQAQGKGIGLAGYAAPDIPKQLRGDSGRIKQILVNLVGNAIKFTKQGAVVVEVAVAGERTTADDLVLRFAVTDTGIGVPRKACESIFCEFTQADASTTRKYGGTGLGLAICKNLVSLMKGDIGVESEVGRGSEFWFTVPFDRRRAAAQSWASGLTDSIWGCRALVVDECDVTRRIFERQLSVFGMEVTGVSDAETALSCLREAAKADAPFGIAIIDHGMRGADGAVFAEQLRKEAGANIDVLILSCPSGHLAADPGSGEAGFDLCLAKPLRPGALLRCLGQVLSGEETDDGKSLRKDARVEPDKAGVHRVLLAEDNPANQKFAVAILRKKGFRVDAVANGLEVIEAVKTRPYDLVLMDVRMPEMDGIEATREIRGLGGRIAEIPIIAVTAQAMEADQSLYLAAGMDDFIAKPVNVAELLETIEFWLGHKATSGVENLPESGTAESRAARRPEKSRRQAAS